MTAVKKIDYTISVKPTCMSATENRRGNRFHHALVEASVNAVVAREIISPMVTLRWCKDDMS